MLRVFEKVPDMLLSKHIVHFSPKYSEFRKDLGDKYFKVMRRIVIPVNYHYILPNADYMDMDLTTVATRGLEPTLMNTMYEVLWGCKECGYIIYPMAPVAGRYLFRLEETAFQPDPTNVIFRYIGGINYKDFPYDQPKLRTTMVKDMPPLIFRLYNDSSDYDKIILLALVNRCEIKELPSPSPEQKRVAREVLHYEEIEWGA